MLVIKFLNVKSIQLKVSGSWVYFRGKISSEQIMQHFSVVCTVVQRQSGAVGSGNLAQPAQLWSVNCRSPSKDEHDMLGEGDDTMTK